MKKKKSKIMGAVAAASAAFGVLGSFGLCCTPFTIAFLGLFGLSSGAFLATYNWAFILMAAVFVALAILFHKKEHNCRIKL